MDEYSPEDIADVMDQADTAAIVRATTAVGEDPEAGARALELSSAMGAPPRLIHDDLQNWEHAHRRSLTSEIIRENPSLIQYVNQNPLADVVSSDDWGTLDRVTRNAKLLNAIYQKFAPVPAFVRGTADAAAEVIARPPVEVTGEETNGERAAKSALAVPIQTMAIVTAPIAGLQEAARRYGEFFGRESEGEQIARDIGGIFESEMGRGGEHLDEVASAKLNQRAREIQAFRDAAIAQVEGQNRGLVAWTKSGMEPPRGVHLEFDAAKVNLNAELVATIETHLDEAQTSTTKERSQELFHGLLKGEYGDTTIAISGDRVSELYGNDRVPAPDDGLLGWVPDIESKLAAARSVGEDVHIPLADWLTKVDPVVAKDLHDDIRAWPGGITAREAAEPVEPKVMIDSPLTQVRGALGTEPMFAIGDRKLELKRAPQYFDQMDEFQFHDETGRIVGELTVIPDAATKTLYVANINGLAGLYSNSFGPSLIRDLKRQLKEHYPDFETITGHRVSGARKAAGVEMIADNPVVKLSLDEFNEGDLRKVLETKSMESLGHGIEAELLRPEDISPEQASFIQIAQDELNKITGGRTKLHIRGDITHTDYPGAAIGGVSFGGNVFLDIFGPDALGVLRHEAGHELRKFGLIKDSEWGVIKDAADAEGWLDKFGIHNRYKNLSPEKKYEEAIVEALRDYAANKYEPKAGVRKIFDRIVDLWNKIVERWTGETGYTADQLFDRMLSGEIGRRKVQQVAERIEPRFAADGPMFSVDPVKMDNLRAEAAGLDMKSFKKLQDLIQKRHDEDFVAAKARAEAIQKRTQTKEWKTEAADLRKEVDATIRQRPDVMADMLVGSGELAGKKLKQRYPLRESDLTPEQKAGLPRHYYSKEGLPVDAAAGMVGFTSGDEMVARLIDYNRDRGEMTAKEHLDKVIETETQRQMEAKLGKLDDNIMADALDQALSETNLHILAEEWQGAAMAAGQAVVDKDLAKSEALRVFGNLRISEVNASRFTTQMLKHYQDATKSLIAGNPADAVVRLQRRYMWGLMAAEARKLETVQRTFDRTAKQFSKREVASADPEYVNWIHDILMRVGKPVRRSIQDLDRQIESFSAQNIPDFVAEKSASLREVPVWDQLYDRSWRKNVDDLTVDEFRAVSDSIKTLVHNARDERKIYRQGEAADFAEVKRGLVSAIADSVNGRVREPRQVGQFQTYYVKHLQIENILNRWDGFDAKGLWNQYVMRDLIDGANQVDAWKKEYAGKIEALGTPKDIGKKIDNPIFKDQDTGTVIPFTRKNLIAVMLNTGNGSGAKSNLGKLAKGYGLSPGEVMTWVHQHATKEDWKFVQGMWDIFAEIKGRADTMYRSLSGGVAPENIPIFPIQTPHGTVNGGYYPVIFHPSMEGKSKKLMGKDPLEQDGFVRATTPAGYTKSRTGYAAPLSLDMDQIPTRISQMLHDVGLRPAVLNTAKVFYDHEIRSAIRKHYGDEYKDELIPYLQAVANSSNRMEKTQMVAARASEFIRQNVITTLVGLNPGTVMKHGPSALVTSMREVGPKAFAKAVTGLFRINEATGETNWQFAIKHSLELQRRDRNWEESLFGASHGLTAANPVGKQFHELRQKIMQLSAKPVALSDMLSAVPTWMAAYEKEMGVSGVHGDAVSLADRAVRRAHGSTAVTSRTGVMRDSSPWLTSVYNFFSDIMNRQMETIWRSGEILDAVKAGDKKAAMASVGGMTASLFAYAIWPAIVEHLASGEQEDPKDPWSKVAGKAMIRTAASSWVGVRDFTNWMLYGYDPQLGLTGTAMKELFSVFKDLQKDHPFARDHAGRLIQDAAAMVGGMTGMVPAQVGRSARFIHDVNTKVEHPRGPWAWAVGLRFGTTKHHSQTFNQYLKETLR